QETVHNALANGRNILIFVDGVKRQKLGDHAECHLPFLYDKLRDDQLVCLILSASTSLASAENIATYGITLGDTSLVEQRVRWLKCIQDILDNHAKNKSSGAK